MKDRIYSALSGILLTASILFVGGAPACAQIDSSGVVTSSDSTIIEAEKFEEKAELTPSPSQPSVDEVIAKRLKVLQNEVPLVYNAKIKGFIDYFSVRNARYALVMERRKRIYFPMFEEILKAQNVPEEIKYLAIVESGLNAKAVSPAGAAGLWQFMTFTGKEFGLKQDELLDERLDPEKATVAACKYLSALHRTFNDWELALASYNCGPGNVRRAIRRSGYKETFWQIYDYLPKETRSYVPQFVALTYIMNHMADHGIVADSLEYPIAFDTITVNQYFDMYTFSEVLNICPDDMRKLNPALKKGILSGAYSYKIKVPVDKMAEFYLNRIDILDACSKEISRAGVATGPVTSRASSATSSSSSTTGTTKVYYTVRSGDALGSIAAKYHVYISDIKRWNKLSSNTIRVGQRLVIYKKGSSAVASSSSSISKSKTSSSSGSTSKATPNVYYVRSGDSLWTISQKFPGLTVDKIKKLNGLTSNSIKVGQKLILN
ncbi:lytic transglycosylase domain-containing protein [Cytophaga aurantiaca]|uniref:lytic transglycosylase domain-containing protein n=1 Tax=Cytophaga aurantiaca TaxID=29530 RepID=UPI0003757FD7|nr:lytic transglycosylase domain-containing protein [Cytophaga aurantiaca]